MKATIIEEGGNQRTINIKSIILTGFDGEEEILLKLPQDQDIATFTDANALGAAGKGVKESPRRATPPSSPKTNGKTPWPDTPFWKYYEELVFVEGPKYFHTRDAEQKKKADKWMVGAIWEIFKFSNFKEIVYQLYLEDGTNKTRRNNQQGEPITIGSPSYLLEALKDEMAIAKPHPFHFYTSITYHKRTPHLDIDNPMRFDYVHELDMDDYEELKAETDLLVEYLRSEEIKFKEIYSGSRSLHTHIPFESLIQPPFNILKKDRYTQDDVKNAIKRVDSFLVEEAGIKSSKHTMKLRQVVGVPYTPHAKTGRLRLPLTRKNYDTFKPEDAEIGIVREKIDPKKYGVPFF